MAETKWRAWVGRGLWVVRHASWVFVKRVDKNGR